MTASLTRDRKVASGLLLRQLRDDGRLDHWIGDATSGLPGEESRRVRALVYGINRNRSLLEAQLEPYLKRPMDKQQPAIQVALLLGSYELLFQDGVPDRAAVSQAVQLVRERGHGGQTGLVNAILRRLSRRELVPTLSDRGAAPLDWAVRCASHPRWLAERMARIRSESEAADWAEANNQPPPLWIRRAGPMGSLPEGALESPLVPGAFSVPAGSGKRVAELPGFADGDWWVQDLAAQAVALLVAAQPGRHILDACAAPGGKSFAVGAAVGPSGRVLALDSSARRLEQLRTGLERLTLPQVEVVQRDLLEGAWEGETFDAVLLDAPCSGLGVLRRHPEIRWNRQEGDLRRQAARQKSLLAAVAPAVAPGGRLVYSVCSFAQEETDAVISSFLRSHSAFRLLPGREAAPGLAPALFDGHVLRTYPHLHDADAFFGAVLERCP